MKDFVDVDLPVLDDGVLVGGLFSEPQLPLLRSNQPRLTSIGLNEHVEYTIRPPGFVS